MLISRRCFGRIPERLQRQSAFNWPEYHILTLRFFANFSGILVVESRSFQSRSAIQFRDTVWRSNWCKAPNCWPVLCSIKRSNPFCNLLLGGLSLHQADWTRHLNAINTLNTLHFKVFKLSPNYLLKLSEPKLYLSQNYPTFRIQLSKLFLLAQTLDAPRSRLLCSAFIRRPFNGYHPRSI